MNFFPLCTAMVCPTISGVIVDLRDQVLWIFFSFRAFIPRIAFSKWLSMNGPFFSERMLLGLPLHDELIRSFVIARFVAQRRHAPWSHGVITFHAALAPSMRVIDRIHYHTAHCRTNSHVAGAACFSDRDVFVIQVADLTDSRHTIDIH